MAACQHLPHMAVAACKAAGAGSVLGDATNLTTPTVKLPLPSRTAATATKTDQGKARTRARAAAHAPHTTVRQPRPSRSAHAKLSKFLSV